MKSFKSKTYLSYLVWLGPVLSIAGITARIVSGRWSPVALGLLIAGAVIIGLGLLVLGSLTPGFWRRRSTQAGTNALVATLAVLAILGLINVLGVRYAQRVDLTENQLYTLSPLSQQVVRNLEQPVKVWVFDPIPDPSDRELLENYRRYGSNLNYEFVDPQLKPSLAERFNVQAPGEVYLEYGAERQLLQSVDEQQRLSEVKLTSGIERLTSDRTQTVYFLQGHGERSLEQAEGAITQAVAALAEKNFTVEPLNLAQEQAVPETASLVAVVGPKRALLETEVQALRDYLANGGSLLVMIDPGTDPKLGRLLSDWGVELGSRVVIDASAQERPGGFGPATPIVTTYGNHPITKEFANGFSLYPLSQPVEVETRDGITQTPLATTNDQSWAETKLEDEQLEFNEQDGDRPGPLTLGVAFSRKAESKPATATPDEESPSPEASPTPSPNAQTEASSSEKTNSESRLIVFGSSSFATDGWFEQQLNSDVFLNSVSWLSKGDEGALSIRPKEPKNRRINLSQVQAGLLGWTALLILPLVGFTTAGVLWWRRR